MIRCFDKCVKHHNAKGVGKQDNSKGSVTKKNKLIAPLCFVLIWPYMKGFVEGYNRLWLLNVELLNKNHCIADLL